MALVETKITGLPCHPGARAACKRESETYGLELTLDISEGKCKMVIGVLPHLE